MQKRETQTERRRERGRKKERRIERRIEEKRERRETRTSYGANSRCFSEIAILTRLLRRCKSSCVADGPRVSRSNDVADEGTTKIKTTTKMTTRVDSFSQLIAGRASVLLRILRYSANRRGHLFRLITRPTL